MQSLRVLSESTSQLVVTQNSGLTGEALFGLLFPWMVSILVIWIPWYKRTAVMTRRALITVIVIAVIFCLIFDFAGGARFFVKHTLTMSRDTGTVTSEERWFGKLSDRTVYDLKAIQYAELEFGRGGTKRIVLVMKDDSVVTPLRSVYSDEEGHCAVVNAINRFLTVQPSSASPRSAAH